MVAFVLLLTLAQGPATQSISDTRELRRTRAGLSALGGGLFLSGEGVPGFGLMGEVGLVFVDRVSASARFSLMTNVGAWDFGIAVGGDYAMTANVGVGIGSAVRVLAGMDSPLVVLVMAPIRLSYSPFARKEKDVERAGLLFGVELAGGTAVISTRGRMGPGVPVPSPVFSGQLSVGYAWW